MSLQTKFLTLSIKGQISITIIALTFFCIFVILGIYCTLFYECLEVDYKAKNYIFIINIKII